VIVKIGAEQVHPVKADAFRFLEQATETYDFIFADPPYHHPRFTAVAPSVLQSNLLRPGGWFVIEHPAGHDFSGYPEWRETRNYGSVHFSFFIRP
jgi:16S rRNA G966 N2-methylase RsmD